MGWLDDTVALVTGGGSGLGRTIVDRFIAEGARVGVLEISEQKAKQLDADLVDAVCVTVGDARSYDDNARAVAATLERFGRLDTFVGNAGIWDFMYPLSDLPAQSIDAAFDELFGLNVKGYLLGAKAALPALREAGGSMVFTLSNAAFYPGGGGPLYTASKHAVLGLVRQLAYELAPAVRVNGVAPGGMTTDLRGPKALDLQDHSIAMVPVLEMMKDMLPVKFNPTADDYVAPYVLLASSQSRAATGTVINIDGGIGVLRPM